MCPTKEGSGLVYGRRLLVLTAIEHEQTASDPSPARHVALDFHTLHNLCWVVQASAGHICGRSAKVEEHDYIIRGALFKKKISRWLAVGTMLY
jgi:hypothetical protein